MEVSRFRFFRQTLSKNPSFSRKSFVFFMAVTYYICKKTGIIHPFFDFFQKTSRPYIRIFLKKSRFPRVGDEMSLYRGYCQASRILAPVFRKNFKIFLKSPVPAGARHRHPDDRAAILHSLYSGFFGKRSEKNGLFLKKVLIPILCRHVYTQKKAKCSPFF